MCQKGLRKQLHLQSSKQPGSTCCISQPRTWPAQLHRRHHCQYGKHVFAQQRYVWHNIRPLNPSNFFHDMWALRSLKQKACRERWQEASWSLWLSVILHRSYICAMYSISYQMGTFSIAQLISCLDPISSPFLLQQSLECKRSSGKVMVRPANCQTQCEDWIVDTVQNSLKWRWGKRFKDWGRSVEWDAQQWMAERTYELSPLQRGRWSQWLWRSGRSTSRRAQWRQQGLWQRLLLHRKWRYCKPTVYNIVRLTVHMLLYETWLALASATR